MAQTLLVSEDYIKRFTPIGELVQWTEIEPKLHVTQDSYIADILGSNFYLHIQGAYQAQTLTPAEIELVSRIRPALGFRVAAKTLPFIHYQIKNKGVQTQRGDYSEPVALEEIRYLKDDLDKDADYYTKRIENYLCENRTLFPEYITNNTTDIVPHRSGNEDNGLVFW